MINSRTDKSFSDFDVEIFGSQSRGGELRGSHVQNVSDTLLDFSKFKSYNLRRKLSAFRERSDEALVTEGGK